MKKAEYELLPIYDTHVFYTNDLDLVKKLIKKKYKKSKYDLSLMPEEGESDGFVAPILSADELERALGYIMYVSPKSGVGVIGHEATHMTNFVFAEIGQDLDIVNDEAQAYLAGYFCQQFMDKIRSKK